MFATILLLVALTVVLGLFGVAVKNLSRSSCPISTWMGFELVKGLGSMVAAIVAAMVESK